MGTKTKFFSSAMTGAPALSGTAGALIAILDAVLVNGFGTANASSLVVAGNVATLTFAAAHPYSVDSVALIAGATPAGLNGEKRVTSITANTITFPAPGIADGAATGAITAKVAPAGWQKLYTGANLAVYKSLAPEATGCVLRVDDSGTTAARVRGYETMTDVNTGSGPFPTTTTIAVPGYYWSKSNAASAAVKAWRIVADDRGFYWLPKPGDTFESQAQYFGDLVSLKSNDPYACVLRAQITDKSNATNSSEDLVYSDNAMGQGGLWIARGPAALGGAVQGFSVIPGYTYNNYVGCTGLFQFPGLADNGIDLSPILCVQATGYRGYFPGIYGAWQSVAQALQTDDVITGGAAMAGKKLRALRTGTAAAGASQGMLFFDAVSDWR